MRAQRVTHETVWLYRATIYETGEHFLRVVFFRAGSVDYCGSWMGPSDCVWMVPRSEKRWEC